MRFHPTKTMSLMKAIWSKLPSKIETPMKTKKKLKRVRTTWITNQKSRALSSRIGLLLKTSLQGQTKSVKCNSSTIHEPLGI